MIFLEILKQFDPNLDSVLTLQISQVELIKYVASTVCLQVQNKQEKFE